MILEFSLIDFGIPRGLLKAGGYKAKAIINGKAHFINIINDFGFNNSIARVNDKRVAEIWLEDRQWHRLLIDSTGNLYNMYNLKPIGSIVFIIEKEALINYINEI